MIKATGMEISSPRAQMAPEPRLLVWKPHAVPWSQGGRSLLWTLKRISAGTQGPDLKGQGSLWISTQIIFR